MPMMLWVASIVEGVIENYVDMGILLGIQASQPHRCRFLNCNPQIDGGRVLFAADQRHHLFLRDHESR
jgi:hypothetical protein